MMSHFMRDVIDPEGVADGRVNAGFAITFASGDAGYGDSRETSASGTEDVADVVVGIANDVIEIRLVLREQQAGVVRRVWVGVGVGVNEQIVVGDEHEANAGFGFANASDAING